ncbi:DUF5067 domain-containing protein [Virgibacillus siamensis]|uniref:DUF5067 domain-containing protein n=1 Tax=Virgibacillus siamensis TaxID=480071 RepID=UPI000984B294|nr:DUF5067 domain-containing protein [Virgibacillus siamensis]
MKNITKILGASVLTLGIMAGCSDGASEKTVEAEKVQNKKEEKTEEVSNQVYEGKDYKFVFKGEEQLKGKSGKQVLAIKVEFTNKSDEAQSAWMAMSVALNAHEVTDMTEEAVLGAIGDLPNPPKYKMDTKINPGKTIDTVIALELQHPGAKVNIDDTNIVTEEKTFERTIKTTK